MISIPNYITHFASRLKDRRTVRKIVVIESDDWGTVRMSSKSAYETLLKKRFPVDECVFNRNDALESNEDLGGLFEVISSVKDKNGNSAVITANNILTNPDFEKIEASNFTQYFFEEFTDTLKKYPNHNRVFELYNEGISNRMFFPQFHGREHVNVDHWMQSLQKADKASMEAFRHQMFTVSRGKGSTCRREYLDAFGIYRPTQTQDVQSSVSEGLKLFHKMWGYKSKSAIAPCYIWSDPIDEALSNGGVTILQSGRAQLVPDRGDRYKLAFKYLGQRNEWGQSYLVRNIQFEPSTDPFRDWVSLTLKRISQCFALRKPAVLSSHRVNYIGSIDSRNRDRGLSTLKSLLHRIVTRWPDVEFMTSVDLHEAITNN
jgi:hypothetical protein